MDTVAFNYIEKRSNRSGQPRAYIVGTRIRVQDIVADHERRGLSPEEIAREYPHLTLAQIYAALAYYFDHKDEVRNHMRVDQEFAIALEDKHAPSPNLPLGKDPNAGSVPS
jgi:uncharacterized protein (DUF433 family)